MTKKLTWKYSKLCTLTSPEGVRCVRKHKGHGMCGYHLTNSKKPAANGDPFYVKPPFVQKVCKADGCEKDQVARGWCDKHVSRFYRNGHTDLLDPPFQTCGIIEDGELCGEPRHSKTKEGKPLCANHGHKYRKWGDANFDFYRDSEFLLETLPCQVPLTYRDDNRICGRVKGGSIGICAAHHQRKLDGDLQTDKPLALVGLTTEERYEVYTDRQEKYIIDKQEIFMDDPCWLWQKVCPSRGYGTISETFLHPLVKGENLAHRAFWIYHNGPIEKGRHVHHLCRNRNCCNPSHLKNWSDWDNIEEASRYKYVNTRRETIEEWLNEDGMTIRKLRQLVKNYD